MFLASAGPMPATWLSSSALAVDRTLFSAYITERIRNHPLIEVTEAEADGVEQDRVTVIATGPLTSEPMADYISQTLGCGKLHFFDAAAPIVDIAGINRFSAMILMSCL